MSKRVLQLGADYRPLGLVSIERAMNMIWQDNAVVEEEHETEVLRSPSIEIPVPLVIRLPHAVKLRPLKDKGVIRRVVYNRDGWKCAYCSKQLNSRTITLDHVKPKIYFIKEGRPVSDANTYDNVVSCCQKCNTKKGGRLPYEAGMMPKITPKKPSYLQTLWAGRVYHPIQQKYVEQWYPELKKNGHDIMNKDEFF